MRNDLPQEPAALLGPNDPDPVGIVNRFGAAPFLLLGDHAGNAIPASLGDLGLPAHERERHIAWDLGSCALGEAIAEQLDATFIHQRFSRLVIDCNRDPAHADAIPPVSDGTMVPANSAIPDAARAARVHRVHEPYHRAIAAEIARRQSAGRRTILVSLHSFTPCLAGGALRPWPVGILHDGRIDDFARALLAELGKEPGLVVGDNEPYQMDETDYTVPRHAFAAQLPYVEIEVRQDLLADELGVADWATRLCAGLRASADRIAT